MRFCKNVPEEHREFLTEQLKKYKKEMSMTKEEKRELERWVAHGRSPYDNGSFIYWEAGYPMDFVNAMRFEKEQQEWFESLSPEEQECLSGQHGDYVTQNDEPAVNEAVFQLEKIPDDELPFK